ncbi:MAG: saccharopine dehydrogenase NADP-binding domain-containing protein [Armatimonas sp.]
MSWMLYGANGYTGRLILREALKVDDSPILAGHNATALQAESASDGLEWRDFEATAPNLGGVTAVLNVARPFETTATPLMQACIAARIPYIDIAGEYPTIQKAMALDDLAKSAGVTLLPGVGLASLPTDSLAVRLVRELPTATNLQIGVWTKSGASRGTLRTILPLLTADGRVRTNGILRPAHFADKSETFDFGHGKPETLPLYPWRADVVTAGHSTQIPTIECFMSLPKALETAATKLPGLLSSPLTQKLLAKWVEGQPVGPTKEQRAEGQSIVRVRARVGLQKPIELGLSLGDPYEFTARAAYAVLKRALAGDLPTGFQTPGLALGPEFVLGLPGVTTLS